VSVRSLDLLTERDFRVRVVFDDEDKMNKENYYWNKLSFLIDLENDPNEEDKLYGIMVEIFQRLEKLEKKSHMHKFQLPENRERYNELGITK
jgi:hypothetical protein